MRHSNSVRECQPQGVLTGLRTCRDACSSSEAYEFGVDDRHYCDESECFTRDARTDFEARMLQINGLGLPDLTSRIAIPALPEAIISHDFDMVPPIPSDSYGPAVACPYWRVPGLLSYDNALATQFRTRQQLAADQLLVLHAEGQDSDLENLFLRSGDDRFFVAAAALDPVLLVGPGYSIYTDGTQCRRWQLYNLKRSAAFVERAVHAGLSCVPWIASNHIRDTERLAEWITRPHHLFTHVAVNFQTKGRASLYENLKFVQSIEQATTSHLHWLIFGVASAVSMGTVSAAVAGQVSFVTGKPIQRGRSGRRIDNQRRIQGIDRYSLVRENIESHRLLARAAAERR